ncbi:MAG: T9SS type A sorting domain-containing protein [bacterium]|nr:T9SS type A sorting domain-containing protein [bacterium]
MKTLLLVLSLIGGTHLAYGNYWSQKADFGSFGRHRGVAIGLGNRVYAGTGHLNGDGSDEWFSEWWEYDPGTNSWAQKADYIGNNSNGDQDLVAIAINGKAYVGMGQFSNATHFCYDPQTNLWTQLSNAPGDWFTNTDPFVIDGVGYYPSYLSSSDSLYRYDAATDTWSTLCALPQNYFHRDPTFVVNGKGYWKRGFSFYEYDPMTNGWTSKAQFPGTAPNNNIGLSQNGYGYFMGGYLGWGDMYPEVWRYNPIFDLWEQLPDYPFAKRRWAVKAKIGDRCYMGLGTNGTNFGDFWEFDQFASAEEFDLDQFKAYPSPAVDHIQFETEALQQFEVVLFDLSGSQVGRVTTENGAIKFNRNGLPSGTYIYQVQRHGNVLHSDRVVFL